MAATTTAAAASMSRCLETTLQVGQVKMLIRSGFHRAHLNCWRRFRPNPQIVGSRVRNSAKCPCCGQVANALLPIQQPKKDVGGGVSKQFGASPLLEERFLCDDPAVEAAEVLMGAAALTTDS